MTPDEFRRHGRAVVEWIADYYERIESFPVLSQVAPGEIRASLPPHPPEAGESFDSILADLEKLILPGITHWQSPNFFAYFPANASGPAMLGALLAARERATGFAGNHDSQTAKLAVYTSAQAHSSIEKAVKIAGMGSENLRLIEVDEKFAMRPEALLRQIKADRQAGLTPCFVCATVGTTSSNAIDPVPEIGRICRENNIWLHVDAAMSGTA